MKHITTVALMLNLGVAGSYAQQQPLKMTLSGSKLATTIDLGPNTRTDEVQLAGNGTLGPFTFRGLRTDATIPQSLGRCGDGSGPILRVVAGGGVFRFQDGSLLTGHDDGGFPLRGFRSRGGPPSRYLSDHWWIRTIRGRERQSCVDCDINE